MLLFGNTLVWTKYSSARTDSYFAYTRMFGMLIIIYATGTGTVKYDCNLPADIPIDAYKQSINDDTSTQNCDIELCFH